MTADHGDNAVPGRYPHQPDGDGRFEVVVRGYDRRQVDEYVANLERTIARLRMDMEQARVRAGSNGAFRGPDEQGRPANAGQGQGGGHTIEAFTGRLQTILQEAHEEAEEIRANAHNFARKEEDAARARITDLERRRDGVVGDLSRARNQLDALVGQLLGNEKAGQKSEDKPRSEGLSAPTPPLRADTPSATPRDASARPDSGPRPHPEPTPRPHPEPTPRPHPEPKPRSETAPRPHPEPKPRPHPEPAPRSSTTDPAGSSAPRPDSAPRPGQQPLGEGARVKPSPSPRTEDARPPRPSPAPSPIPASQGSPSQQSQPRPTPSPRPRTAPSPGGVTPSPTTRNGVNQNGATTTRDDDGSGGHNAFGTGAR